MGVFLIIAGIIVGLLALYGLLCLIFDVITPMFEDLIEAMMERYFGLGECSYWSFAALDEANIYYGRMTILGSVAAIICLVFAYLDCGLPNIHWLVKVIFVIVGWMLFGFFVGITRWMRLVDDLATESLMYSYKYVCYRIIILAILILSIFCLTWWMG